MHLSTRHVEIILNFDGGVWYIGLPLSIYVRLPVRVDTTSFYFKTLVSFVKIFSEKSPEYLNYIRFVPVPLTTSLLAKQLTLTDSQYAQLFTQEGPWQWLLERVQQSSFLTGQWVRISSLNLSLWFVVGECSCPPYHLLVRSLSH